MEKKKASPRRTIVADRIIRLLEPMKRAERQATIDYAGRIAMELPEPPGTVSDSDITEVTPARRGDLLARR